MKSVGKSVQKRGEDGRGPTPNDMEDDKNTQLYKRFLRKQKKKKNEKMKIMTKYRKLRRKLEDEEEGKTSSKKSIMSSSVNEVETTGKQSVEVDERFRKRVETFDDDTEESSEEEREDSDGEIVIDETGAVSGMAVDDSEDDYEVGEDEDEGPKREEKKYEKESRKGGRQTSDQTKKGEKRSREGSSLNDNERGVREKEAQKKKRVDPLQQARLRYKEKQQEKERKRQELEAHKKQVEDNIVQRKHQARKLSKKNARGQPIMKHMIGNLLDQIQKKGR